MGSRRLIHLLVPAATLVAAAPASADDAGVFNACENRAWRRALAGRSAKRQFDRATDEFLRAFKQGQRAVRRFRKLGLVSPERAITQTPKDG